MPFSFNVSRQKRKTLVVFVKSGKVEVRAPRFASSKWISEFVSSHSDWILSEIAQQKRKSRQRLVIADRREVLFMGRPRTIVVLVGPQQEVRLTRDFLFIYTRKNTQEKIEHLFNEWLKDKAREYMAVESFKVARQLGVRHKLKDVVFRKTKSKWGHCCQDGTIQYNWLTMMAPKKVIHYLIAHECCHLRHMDHSKAFWNTVESICPDYKELRDWLGDNGHRFWSQPE